MLVCFQEKCRQMEFKWVKIKGQGSTPNLLSKKPIKAATTPTRTPLRVRWRQGQLFWAVLEPRWIPPLSHLHHRVDTQHNATVNTFVYIRLEEHENGAQALFFCVTFSEQCVVPNVQIY